MKYGTLQLAYHGCNRTFGEDLLAGTNRFKPSINPYDWLGSGIYFWENNLPRAREWAKFMCQRGRIREPFVVGAVLDLGECLDTTEGESLSAIREAYTSLERLAKLAGEPLPQNKKATPEDDDLTRRYLDNTVINHVHELREQEGLPPFDTVRGAFWEGKALYPGSGIKEKTHIQICVRNLENIRAVFRV